MRERHVEQSYLGHEAITAAVLIDLNQGVAGRCGELEKAAGKRPAGNVQVDVEEIEIENVASDALEAAQIMPDERKESAVAFLKAAIAYDERLGVAIQRVMTDNGSCYRSKAFRKACERLGLKHIRTKPYTPKTNGKAERFIQTALREWLRAYAHAYQTSDHRADQLPIWLHCCNRHRPHGSLQSKIPISRLGPTDNNLLRFHS